MFNNGSNVSATIICEKGVGKPTQACLILKTSVSSVDDSCKACKLTYTVYMQIVVFLSRVSFKLYYNNNIGWLYFGLYENILHLS